jgi:hypothetical protein
MYSLLAAVTLAFSLTACATAGEGDDDDGPGPTVDAKASNNPADASVSPWPDARPLPDARPINMPVDANQGGFADGAINPGADGGLFCTSSAQCTQAGTCCFSLSPPNPGFCVPGTEVAGVCVPTS